MGIVLLVGYVPRDQIVINLPDHGLIYFKSDGSLVCFISHDLKSYFWCHYSTLNNMNNLPYYNPEPDLHLKIIQLPLFYNKILINQPTSSQIKSHVSYFSNIVKYILLSQSLCYDVNYVIFDKLFWLEINDIFVSSPLVISALTQQHDALIVKSFKNMAKEYPHNWMLS